MSLFFFWIQNPIVLLLMNSSVANKCFEWCQVDIHFWIYKFDNEKDDFDQAISQNGEKKKSDFSITILFSKVDWLLRIISILNLYNYGESARFLISENWTSHFLKLVLYVNMPDSFLLCEQWNLGNAFSLVAQKYLTRSWMLMTYRN